jgi:hypothetical protein
MALAPAPVPDVTDENEEIAEVDLLSLASCRIHELEASDNSPMMLITFSALRLAWNAASRAVLSSLERTNCVKASPLRLCSSALSAASLAATLSKKAKGWSVSRMKATCQIRVNCL